MRDRVFIKGICNLKNNSYKLRHAPYSNRYGQVSKYA